MGTNIIKKFHVRVYRAIDNNELCQQYLKGHVKVLTDFGITNITSNNGAWIENPHTYCLVAEDTTTKELVGGIRIQIADGILPLPVEKAIGHMDDRIYTVVKDYLINGGIGELSGLWVSNSLRGIGMGPYLVRAIIASANQLNFKILIGICGENTLSMFKNVGFLINQSLGKMGGFPYPREELTAHVVGILNSITLESASIYDKEIMISLRKNPIIIRKEITNNYISEIDYDLIYENVTNNTYGLNS